VGLMAVGATHVGSSYNVNKEEYMRSWIIGIVLGLLVVAPGTGYAADMAGDAKWTISLTKDYTASPWTSQVGWSNRAIGKLGFGAKNLLLGWTDLFVEPKQTMDEGGNVLVGLGKGLWEGVLNTVGGAVHIVTFPITGLDAPLPGGGTQVLS